MGVWAYVPPVRRCIDAAGAGLVVSDCGKQGTPMLQLVITSGQSIHIAPAQLPELLWQMMVQGGNPDELLRELASLHAAAQGPATPTGA